MRVPRGSAYRRLLGAATISQLGDWSARLALAALLFAETDDAIWVGAVSAAFIAPWIGLGQVLTAWAQRYDRQTVMVLADSLRAMVFLFIALVDMAPLLTLATVFVGASVDPVFEANASATVYGSLDLDDRDEGIRVKQVLNLLAQVGGIGMAGVALRWLDPQTILAVNALSFAVSALVVRTVSLDAEARGDRQGGGTVRAALRVAAVHPHIRAALLATMVTVFAATAIEAQVVVLAADRPPWVLPVASALLPLMAAAGAATAPSSGGTRSVLRRTLAVSTASAAACAVMLQTDTAIGIVFVGAFAGLMFQTTTSGQVIAFRHLPEAGRASIINMLQTLVFVAISAGGLLSGVAIAAFGLAGGLQVCLAVTVVAWLVPLPDEMRYARPESYLE